MQATSSPQAFSRRIGRLTKFVLLLLLCAAVLGTVLVLGTGRPEPLAMAPSALQAESLDIAQLPARETNDLVFRPLFWAARRPLVEPEQVMAVEAPPENRLEQVRLLGVFASEAQAGAILIVRGARRRLLQGERVDGWQLSAVSAGKATFERAGDGTGIDDNQRQVVLELERNTHE